MKKRSVARGLLGSAILLGAGKLLHKLYRDADAEIRARERRVDTEAEREQREQRRREEERRLSEMVKCRVCGRPSARRDMASLLDIHAEFSAFPEETAANLRGLFTPETLCKNCFYLQAERLKAQQTPPDGPTP